MTTEKNETTSIELDGVEYYLRKSLNGIFLMGSKDGEGTYYLLGVCRGHIVRVRNIPEGMGFITSKDGTIKLGGKN